jgi:transposase-like protein
MSDNGKVDVSQEDTEVEPRAVRRQYTAEYKERILDEIDRAEEPGELGAILRREGLYSQIISKWRQQRQKGQLRDSHQTKRGRKADPQAGELSRLKAENERLRARLERAEAIIDVQKKVSQLLGGDEQEPEAKK